MKYKFVYYLFSAKEGHKSIVELLLNNNAKINHQARKGITALFMAGKSITQNNQLIYENR